MSKKPGRLALKKKTGAVKNDDISSTSQSTILSMFKKQTRKEESGLSVRPQSESGSEGDLIITGVSKQNVDIGDQELKSKPQNEGKTINKLSLKRKGSDAAMRGHKNDQRKGRLSLSKRKSRSDSSSSVDKDAIETVTVGKRRKIECEPSDSPPPYKLRKHKTVSIIDVASEDESGTEDQDDVDVQTISVPLPSSCDLVTKSQLSGSDTDDHGTDGSGSESMDRTYKQNRYRVRKKKAELKRSKTDGKLYDLKSRKKHTKKFDRDVVVHKEKQTISAKSLKSSCSIKQSGSKGMKGTEQVENDKPKGKKLIAKAQVSVIKSEQSFHSPSKDSTTCIDLTDSPVKNQTSPSKILINDKQKSKSKIVTKSKKTTDVKTLKQGTLKHLFLKQDSGTTSSKSKNKTNKTTPTCIKDEQNEALKISDKDKKNSLDNLNSNQTLIEVETSENRSDPAKKDGFNSAKNEKDTEEMHESSKTDEGVDEQSEGKPGVIYRVPYYLENFRTILDSVLTDKENAKLFNEKDMTFISAFNQLTDACQKLYVRIFGRKLAWLSMNKLKYPEISDDIPDLVDQLQDVGLLQHGDQLDDLDIVLKILAAPDLKLLAKSFHINTAGTKEKIIELLLKKSQESSIGTMFTGGKGLNTKKAMLNRAIGYAGKICRLEESGRAVFIRVLMLFSLYNTNFDEDSGGGGQNQLFQMLMANIGRVVYPSYTVDRQMAVFQDRGALVRFETALQFELDLQTETEKNRWKQAHEVYLQAQSVGAELKKDKSILKWDQALPQYLRLYTARSVYVRIDSLGVEILQRLKMYREAVALLEELLEQDLYCNHHRGHWYERLALNLDAHLKSQKKSLDVIQRGLSDVKVHTGRRLALYERAKKICEAPKSKYADKMALFEHDEVLPTPEVYIEGMVISDATSIGMKYQFIMSGDTDQTTLCAVEELVLEHYKNNGYPEGLHAEGSIISNLFMMFFWEVMYMAVPNVFHGPFQTCPLDWHTQDFYKNRTEAVDQRLGWLQQADEDELVAAVEETWENHNGENCTGISWERFTGPETLQGLVRCMGGHVISGIMDRFVKNPRHTRSGFPDLTLWNTETKAFKICEVKGPNDRLSNKQILWIDYLQKLGVDAEVCYVKAVGSKRLKPASSKS